MIFENLSVARVCLHEVHQRDDNRNIVPPTYGTALLNLPQEARDTFVSRILAAFKSAAQCMEMSIHDCGVGSVTAIGSDLIGLDDQAFVARSAEIADGLAHAQGSCPASAPMAQI